jgi:hypothetical protein
MTGWMKAGETPVRNLAFDTEGRLYVASISGVKVYRDDGAPASGGPEFNRSAAAVVSDREGNIFIAGRTRIHKFDPGGSPAGSWGREESRRGKFRFITGMSVHEGLLFVADAGNRSIHRIAVDGDYVDAMPDFHVPSAYFDCGTDREGSLYIGHPARHRVEKYDRNLELTASWGNPGSGVGEFCGCCNPTNLAVYPDGRVVTAEKGIPRLKVYTPSGLLLAYASPESLGVEEHAEHMRLLAEKPGGTPACHDGWPGMPMAIDSRGRLAVSLPNAGEIRFYEIFSA